MKKINHRSVLSKRSSRRGSAVVELAFILPILLLITFGTLEICESIFLRQKIEIAAQQGARVAVRKEATVEEVREAVGEYLDARGIQYDELANVVTVTPDPQLAPELTAVTIRVEVQVNDNLRMPSQLYSFIVGSGVVGEVAMFKEFSSSQLLNSITN